jgi:flagellar basal body-associated protein FliL
VLPEKPSTPGSEQPASPRPEQNIPQYTESSSPYVVNYKKIRQGMRLIRIEISYEIFV